MLNSCWDIYEIIESIFRRFFVEGFLNVFLLAFCKDEFHHWSFGSKRGEFFQACTVLTHSFFVKKFKQYPCLSRLFIAVIIQSFFSSNNFIITVSLLKIAAEYKQWLRPHHKILCRRFEMHVWRSARSCEWPKMIFENLKLFLFNLVSKKTEQICIMAQSCYLLEELSLSYFNGCISRPTQLSGVARNNWLFYECSWIR